MNTRYFKKLYNKNDELKNKNVDELIELKNKLRKDLLNHFKRRYYKEYAIKNGVIDRKWNLVTGDKKQIYTMARKSYLAVKLGKPEELYDMVHTENFVLVDSKRRVRGFYDGTKKEDIERLIEDINFLCTQ
jgi:cytochrome oxidase Cu insertion factor (SCO1/SenC/PrrC family)